MEKYHVRSKNEFWQPLFLGDFERLTAPDRLHTIAACAPFQAHFLTSLGLKKSGQVTNGPIYLGMRPYWPRTEPPSMLPIGKGN